ncbi:MAG TPA: ABC transporter permease subunit [Anaerolineales bacterium]|nr:ABC transporter permease subunit [Anaerolineales bacterium]
MNIKAFWRDVRFLQWLGQVIFIVLLALMAGYLYVNVAANLERQGLAVGYGFMKNPASFDIGESFIPYQAADSYRRALIVGLINTLVVSVLGVVLTTIVGVLAGIARLSSNWLVNKFAAAYVGVIRNTPLLIQLMFWYFGVIVQLPSPKQAVEIPGSIFLTNRGIYLPWAEATATFPAWRVYLLVALISIIVVRLLFQFIQRRSSLPMPFWWNIAYLLIPAVILWVGAVIQPEPPFKETIPELGGLNFKGGMRFTPEFIALLFGLVIYTGAFVAEIVRAGIQSVSKGQVEAARSLGLTTGQTLRLIVMPQALRVIIPPLTSQYLNLAKNSSLAIAIGYPDLFSIAGTVFNQTGAAIEIIVVMMLSYLSISLFTSLVMNIYNSRTRLVER